MPQLTPEEIKAILAETMPDIGGAVQNMADSIYGPANPLSADQEQQLYGMNRRAARLMPINPNSVPRMPSTMIYGNPYSYDISPVTNALQQAVVGLVNRERFDRVYGNEKRSARLQRKADEMRSRIPTNPTATTSGPDGKPVALAMAMSPEQYALADKRRRSADRMQRKADRYRGFADVRQALLEQKTKDEQRTKSAQELAAKYYPQLADRIMQHNMRMKEIDATTKGQIKVKQTPSGKGAGDNGWNLNDYIRAAPYLNPNLQAATNRVKAIQSQYGPNMAPEDKTKLDSELNQAISDQYTEMAKVGKSLLSMPGAPNLDPDKLLTGRNMTGDEKKQFYAMMANGAQKKDVTKWLDSLNLNYDKKMLDAFYGGGKMPTGGGSDIPDRYDKFKQPEIPARTDLGTIFTQKKNQ